ncbi:endonuclease/exonuclease/phosphatase family protein [Rhizoctonia solani 123E]|uniref:Endonuclease/exonuclease/phosphatase family protein n=1 Tax=Rhizoctonia solani 123E TaxID=1423351 RepID=A0A074S7A9_9AGAM|nr:endonuclease/exonuclease/phosphatase family protein [Rhizoctonia solani 123E]
MKIHQLIGDAYKVTDRTLSDHVRAAQMVLGRLLSISGSIVAVAAQAVSIASINGDGYISPYAGQTVSVQGLVTAKGPSGFWLADVSNATSIGSKGIYVFSTSATVQGQVAVGDIVSLGSARVVLYRAAADTDNIFLNELTSPTNITVLSSSNTVTPIVIGVDHPGPPTEQYSSLDDGNVFRFPNNQSQLSTANLTLQPAAYGLDYWQSLVGTLVTVHAPIALGYPNSYGDFWTHGDWKVTGKNKRGGLTITSDAAGATDANPEAIAIGSPLDGTRNPRAAANSTGLRLGSTLSDITGILTYAFDTYRVLPLTAPRVISAPDYNPVPTDLLANSTADAENCSTLTLGDYNVENLDPKDAHLPVIASHIVQYLKTPDIMWLQEIQDENGATNDGTTSAKGTLDALVAAIRNASIASGGPGVNYSWAQVDPIDGTNGGEPGGNIRPAFIYKADVLEIINFSQGTANDSAIVSGTGSNVTLNFNPALVSPEDSAFVSSRKPLVAHFRVRATNATLWSINVHQASKGGSSPLEGDWRTPANGAITARIAQAKVTSGFIKTILDADPTANVIIAGDFNEFLSTPVAFEPYYSVGMRDLDVVVNHDPVERYTYIFDMNTQQLDHALASPAIWNSTGTKVEWEHVHVNTWRETTALRASDHDPSVGRIRLCGVAPQACDVKIGKWCAAPLPSFNNRATCLASAAVCKKQSDECYKRVSLLQAPKCVAYTATCAKDAVYCATSCSSTKCSRNTFPQ